MSEAGVVDLTSRRPALGAADLVSRFRPPRRFAGVRFETFLPSPAHPSQAAALADMERMAAALLEEERPARWSWRLRRGGRPAEERPARYLDGGFGVGKTHLLAALWHAAPEPKAYLTFEELTAVIGFLGMEEAQKVFSGFRLVCIDEFELDDVANTLMAVTFLRSVIGAGTRVAATSNTLPDRLGEGRFAADDFQREIAAIAGHFEVLRIDGPDYRASTRRASADALSEAELGAVLAGATAGSVAAASFERLLAHLRRVHPVQFGPMLDGLDTVVVRGLAPIDNQGAALLFVQLVDRIYDGELRLAASGCPVASLFPESYRHGGYRKKYGRCESRLEALLGECRAELADAGPAGQ